jgi:hypothetical protein
MVFEPSFRDTKDLRFGMGMAEIRIAEPERRDRLLLISAFAMVLLTMLGTAGESLGMDRLLKSNTSKTRTHSCSARGAALRTDPQHAGAPAAAADAAVRGDPGQQWTAGRGSVGSEMRGRVRAGGSIHGLMTVHCHRDWLVAGCPAPNARSLAMCNLYSMTKGQRAIRELARAMFDRTVNLPPLPASSPTTLHQSSGTRWRAAN